MIPGLEEPFAFTRLQMTPLWLAIGLLYIWQMWKIELILQAALDQRS
jgi:hypothetical protein